MTIKTIDQNPKITDTVLFEIETPDANDCFKANPYKVDNLIVYMIERDFLGNNHGEYNKAHDLPSMIELVTKTTKAVCDNPTEENIAAAQEARNRLESTRTTTKYYYKDRRVVHSVGTTDYPAWIGTDLGNSRLVNVPTDDQGNSQYGHYTYEWTPEGTAREGDYIVCWTWTPLPAGESLSAHMPFKMDGDSRAVITIPTHITNPDKYEILLERYLPEMYKNTIAEGDITPTSLDLLNQSIAQGFTFLEDLTNQIIDLFDANALHESLLMFLSNLFGLKLKSGDPTLWRRQIKEAIPLFKTKGTRQGLEFAFAQAGMQLNDFSQLWQVVSNYTWEESFKVGDSFTFQLSKDNVVVPVTDANFGLWVRKDGEESYTSVPKDYVEFTYGEDLIWYMTWIGDQLSASPITLESGDIIKVLYEHKEVPGQSEQTIEDYIRALPLGDLRDENDQEYPPKNWNVRVIDEDDPLFDILIPVRHPYHDPLVFGHIRTEFAYSENIYNMEEYNGSTRPSFDPCHIDKEFVDPCGSCLSSLYTVDVGVEELNNDRLLEVQDILREYTPFHAQLYALNFSGEVNEFVPSPVEQIDSLVTINRSEYVLSGQANPFFIRTMEGGLSNWIIDREDLSQKQTLLSGKLGTAYNDYIALVSVNHRLENLGVINQYNALEVLSPSLNAGTYVITRINGNIAEVSLNIPEPVDESEFTFNLSNINYSNWFTSITQKNKVSLSDENISFSTLGVKTNWDVANTPDYTGGAWKASIPAYSPTPYVIDDIQDGVLILVDHDNSLPTSNVSDVPYSILTDLDVEVVSDTSDISVEKIGYVNLNDNGIVDINEFAKAGDYLKYINDEYEIVGFDGNNLLIADWVDGDVNGMEISIRRRLLSNAIGMFGYNGLNLITFSNHEAELGINNGTNPSSDPLDDSHCKENYMFRIGNDFFRILEWDGKNVKLSGREQNWTTSSFGGTAVSYSVVWFPTKQVNVQFLVFDNLDRDGRDVIVREIEDQVEQNVAIVALSNNPGSGIHENVSQQESVSFVVEKRNGKTTVGEI